MTGRGTTLAWGGGGFFFLCVALTLLLASGLLPASAWASGLQVTPVLLEFKPGQRAHAVSLSNSGQRAIQAQVRIRAWRQADGGDALEPTTELVASPPMVEIPPGQTQIVRIVRTQQATHATAESAYRLLVDELPDSSGGAAPESAKRPGGVQFLFRYLIPIFVGPQEATPTKGPAPEGAKDGSVTARLTLAEDQRAKLTIRNTGARRVKLSNLSYTDAASGESVVLGSGLFGYVLAGSTRQWTLPVPASMQRTDGQLKTRINEDNDETVLAQDPGQP